MPVQLGQGENLDLMWFRKAFWILLAHENPVEVECRAKETEFEGPYKSVTEKEKYERTNSNG